MRSIVRFGLALCMGLCVLGSVFGAGQQNQGATSSDPNYPITISNTIAISFNEATDTIRGGITLLPRRFSLQNYKAVFASGTIYNAFFISVARTVINTITSVLFTSMIAFALSRREYVFRKPLTFIIVLSVAPRAGAWIETCKSWYTVSPSNVAPRAGAWIETESRRAGIRVSPSRPVRACGLKLCLV